LIVINPSGQVVKSIFFGGGSSVGPPNVNPSASNAFVEVIGGNEGISILSLEINQNYVEWTATAASQWANYDFGMVGMGDVLYYPGGEYNGMVYAVSLQNGTQLWQGTTTGNCDSWTPTLYQNRLFWNSCSNFGEMSVTDGTVLWSVNLNPGFTTYSANWVPSISSKGFAYGMSVASGVVMVVQIDLTKQHTTWGFPCAEISGGIFAMAVDDDAGMGWIPCMNGVMGIDLSTGFQNITLPCSDCYSDQPIVTMDYVIARGYSGTYIWSKETGQLGVHNTVKNRGRKVYPNQRIDRRYSYRT